MTLERPYDPGGIRLQPSVLIVMAASTVSIIVTIVGAVYVYSQTQTKIEERMIAFGNRLTEFSVRLNSMTDTDSGNITRLTKIEANNEYIKQSLQDIRQEIARVKVESGAKR